MKCPHCEYAVGGRWEDGEWVHIKPSQAEYGDFWKHPVDMQRESADSRYTQSRELYACPCCNKTFIDY